MPAMGVAAVIAFGACSGSSDTVCSDLAGFQTAAASIDGQSVAEFEASYQEAKTEFEELRDRSDSEHLSVLDEMNLRMTEFEEELASGDITGMMSAAQELRLAALALDGQMGCTEG